MKAIKAKWIQTNTVLKIVSYLRSCEFLCIKKQKRYGKEKRTEALLEIYKGCRLDEIVYVGNQKAYYRGRYTHDITDTKNFAHVNIVYVLKENMEVLVRQDFP